MKQSVSDLLYATVAYADIFSYPLTVDDVYYWFIRSNPKRNIRMSRVRGITKKGSVFVLRGRKRCIVRQKIRLQHSRHKWNIARSIGKYFRLIPTVILVGVTGGLAMRNADKKDDIDLFIITTSKTTWITRFLAVLLLDMLRVRRTPGEKYVADKICLNMFMSEDRLRLPKDEQDLFAAHEVLQMEPLWSRGDIYSKFLFANNWVKHLLPVAWEIKQHGRNIHPKSSHWWTIAGIIFLRLFESPARHFQLWYMRKRKTVEFVSSDVLRFHPKDARIWVRKEFARRLVKVNIPLDNIFYVR